MKAIMVMEMPECCLDCPMMNGSGDCVMQDEEANYDSNTLRDLRDGCPLVPIPDRKQNACSHGFAAGWNACLDAIERSRG